MELTRLRPENLIFSTSRLNIRAMRAEDWHDFHRLQSAPDMLKYISAPLDEQAIEDKFNRCLACWQAPENWHNLMIFEKDSDAFVGCFGFRISNTHSQRAEIGFLALSTNQGKGYVSEAGTAVIDFLLNTLAVKKIEAFCSTENVASTKVLERLNLIKEGTLMCDHLVGEEWQNSYVYGLVNS